MDQGHRKWSGIGWIAAFVGVLYAISVYNSVFAKRPAYIYDPATDRLFELVLMQSFSSCDKWVLAIPFRHCFFGEVANVDYRGKFHDKVTEIEADRNLMQKDSKAWLQKRQQEINTLLTSTPKDDFEFWDIVYHRADGVHASDLLPPKLSEFADMKTDALPDAFPVDIVLVRSRLKNKAAEIEIVRNAVLIRGKAAYRVQELGL